MEKLFYWSYVLRVDVLRQPLLFFFYFKTLFNIQKNCYKRGLEANA